LDQLLSRAFAVAKRVRTETAVGSSSVSVASVAVELAEKIFGNLKGKSVYLVGAGKMSELAARHLLAHGAEAIFVANRTYDRAIGLAHKFKGQAIEFSRLYDNASAPISLLLQPARPISSSGASTANSFWLAAEIGPCSSSTSPCPAMLILN